MASVFKVLTSDDVANTVTLLHEAIPLTGALASGSYGSNNIKNYSHGMFQSVYDYPYLSSSANHIYDISAGYSSGSALSSSTNVQHSKKLNMYNMMAQVLMGTDNTGSILLFDEDGDLIAGGTKLKEVYFITFSRLLVKDEIKKGSFTMTVMSGGTVSNPNNAKTINDSGSINDFRINSPVGEYGILYDTSGSKRGLIYYQAGTVVLTASLFNGEFGDTGATHGTASVNMALTGATIQQNADGLRRRIVDIAFNNTTELNSTIYFCRLNHNEFNYSSNPTYLSASKLVVKNNSFDAPVSYITSIGLYGADNELLAVGKLSETLKKTPDNSLTVRLRTDW